MKMMMIFKKEMLKNNQMEVMIVMNLEAIQKRKNDVINNNK